MTIDPVVRTVETKASPARAFELFTSRMADWWPRGKTIGKNPHAAVVMEPYLGGRWFEVDGEGNKTQWGDVLAWDPPHRLLLAWRIDSRWTYDPAFLTELELTFAQTATGGTLVTLEHRNLERFGENAAAHAASLNGDWPAMLANFAELADADRAESV